MALTSLISAARPAEMMFRSVADESGSWRGRPLEDRGHEPSPLAVAGGSATGGFSVGRAAPEPVAPPLVTRDPLTGLADRHSVLDQLTQALQTRAVRPGGGADRGEAPGAARPASGVLLAVALVDLDRFGSVNVDHGYLAGDQLLAEAAARIRAVTAAGDRVGRWTGDAFLVVLARVVDADDARVRAERLRWALDEPYAIGGDDVYVSASVGVGLCEPGDTVESLVRIADAALQRAKALGRSRVEVADRLMRTQVSGSAALTTDLRAAIDAGEFVVHYQPIVSVPDGRVLGAEALARWAHPTRGLLVPAQFISIAEDSGLIVGVGQAVLERALADAAEWQPLPGGSLPFVAINLSARQFEVPNLAFQLARAISTVGIDPQRVHLEVTESVAMEGERSASVLFALKDLGLRISLDDFGTGYSSLAYLRRLPIDTLKVDKSFVDHLADRGPDLSILNTIVNLGRAIGADVLAEGVESRDQMDILGELGCQHAQGFLFARPVTNPSFVSILAAAPRPGGGPAGGPRRLWRRR